MGEMYPQVVQTDVALSTSVESQWLTWTGDLSYIFISNNCFFSWAIVIQKIGSDFLKEGRIMIYIGKWMLKISRGHKEKGVVHSSVHR